MSYEFYNPSPTGARIGDCVIRAICKALDKLTMMRESAPNEKSRRAVDKMISELED